MFEIKICSDIVSDEEQTERIFFGCPAGITFTNIADTLAAMPAEETDIHLRIYSQGGSVREGWAIVDALRNTGKKITATIEGDVASMASVVLLAASERKALPHARILIHRPYIGYYPATLNDKSAEWLRNELATETARVLDFYVERTGASREVLEALMDEERYISVEEAKDLGFITEIIAPLSACHKNRITNQNPNKNQMKNKSLFSRMVNALKSAFEVVAYDLTTANGDTLTIEKEEGAAPAVGDPASPDGEHVMPDGQTIVVTDGVIVEIREAEADEEEDTTEEQTEDTEAQAKAEGEEQTEEDDTTEEEQADDTEEEDEVAKLKERIAELEAENEELKKNVKSAADSRILNAVALAGGEEWLTKATTSPAPKIKRTPAKKDAEAKAEREDWLTMRKKQLERN